MPGETFLSTYSITALGSCWPMLDKRHIREALRDYRRSMMVTQVYMPSGAPGTTSKETDVHTPSEHQLRSKLKFSRVLRTRNHAEVRCPENSAWKIEIRMIQRVENIQAELHRELLMCDPLLLE